MALGWSALLPAEVLITNPGTGTLRADHTGTLGEVFRTGPKGMIVTALGFWDEGADGLAASHDAGIFQDALGGSLLVSTTIPSGTAGNLVGDFRYQPITPVALLPNTYYTVGAQFAAGSDRFIDQNAGTVFDLTGLDRATNTRAARWVSSATLAYPNNQASLNTGYIGPNLLYQVAAGTPGRPTNRAPFGTATASSAAYGTSARDGIDFNRDGNYADGSLWHSANSGTPAFYQVDLGQELYVDRIQIVPRRDAVQGSVENFRLTVFADDGAGQPGAVVWTHDYLPANAANWSWGTTDPAGAHGRFVKLERLDANPDIMAFAEFEVYASGSPLGQNLALGKPVTASPAGFGASPGDGNDGDIDGDFYHPGFPIYHSNTVAVGQFWQVDLGSRQTIDYLELFGRSDGGTTTQYKVTVLSPFGTPVASSIIDSNMAATAQTYDHTIDLGGTTGRYVRVETTRNEYLAFAELRAFGSEAPPAAYNVAPGGTATGLNEGYGSVFRDGIDGNRDGLFGDGSVYHSLDDDTPAFYQVDLGKSYYVDRIQIAPRRDAAQHSVENFRLTVFADDGAGQPGAAVWTGAYFPSGAADWSWGTTDPAGARGRFVRLDRLDSSPASPRFLAFAEFEVYGSEGPLLANVALGKPVTASPAGFGSSAGAGNDGNIDGNFFDPGFPVYHSAASGVGQFWEVDLGWKHSLEYVELFDRTDGATTPLYELSLLDLDRNVVASRYVSSDISATVQDYDHLIDFNGAMGRYLRLETPANEYLAFAELRAFGTLVPEPGTMVLLALGLAGLGLCGALRRRRAG